MPIEVGTVTSNARYPLKGAQGEFVEQLYMDSSSVEGDRVAALILPRSRQIPNSISSKQFPKILEYIAHFQEGKPPTADNLRVTAPDGEEYDPHDERFFAQLERYLRLKEPAGIYHVGRNTSHSTDVSLIGEETIEEIARQSGSGCVDPRRMRANVYFNAHDGKPFTEDSWVGKFVRIGSKEDGVVLDVTKLDKRCAIVDRHPQDGSSYSKPIHKTIIEQHNNTAGVYAKIDRPGFARLNDKIWLADSPTELR